MTLLATFVRTFYWLLGTLFYCLIAESLLAAPAPSLPLSELTCPELEVASDQSAVPPGAEKRLPILKVQTLSITAALFDANPVLFAENTESVADGPYLKVIGAQRAEEMRFEQLMSLNQERLGVAADGVSQLLLRMQSTVAGRFKVALSEGDEGSVFLLGGGQTCATKAGHFAFALYTAPAEFDRSADSADQRVGRTAARDAGLLVSFSAERRPQHFHEAVAFKIVRPPVVLIHGLFDNGADAWLTPAEGGRSLAAILDEKGFETFVIDYSNSNGRGGDPSSFYDNRHVLWSNGRSGFLGTSYATVRNQETGETAKAGGIERALKYYREELKIAAARADVIGHSMGGVLARVYASDRPAAPDRKCGVSPAYNPNYRRAENFGAGDINRLITVGTPHFGSGQPAVFELLTKSPITAESWESWGTRTLLKYGAFMAEGVSANSPASIDLGLESCALKRIGATQVASHLVVGATRPGGQRDPVLDPSGEYFATLDAVGAFFFYFPEILDAYWALIGQDWQPPLSQETRFAFDDMFSAEAEFWAREIHQRKDVGWLTGVQEESENTYVPYALLEALRSVMFRFDQNDSTVRVDSQKSGLEIGTPQVTFVAADTKADIKESTMHRFIHRAAAVQNRIVEVLSSGPERFAESLPPAGQFMPAYPPPKDFGVNWGLTGEAAVAWSGLPANHAQALLKVARGEPTPEDDVVIMMRPVNPDATELILRGAATKGMNIKGKSANWGPQRGYLPVAQRYSKLWRTSSGTERDAKIAEYSALTQELLAAKKPQYQRADGKPLAIARQLEHCWPAPCPAAGAAIASGQEIYSVWADAKQADAEAAIFMCRGRVARPQDCAAWFDWRNGDANPSDLTASGEFDIKTAPNKPKRAAQVAQMEPLLVLADNQLASQPFLTADFDLLATGFFCPQGKNSADPACQALVAREDKRLAKDQRCSHSRLAPVGANYGRGLPPDPMPCFDPQTGLITEAQKGLLTRLNHTIAEDTGYESGNVSHHGPETQFFKSPYVDYPITLFDPSRNQGRGEIIAIPMGPEGFRDMHLKRAYERLIRQGFWLYPNTDERANWHWMKRGKNNAWQGWLYEDDVRLGSGESVEELPRPKCVQDLMDHLAKLRRGEESVRPAACVPTGSDVGGS